jgi:transcriptional regulator with XRE-family HTH domain
MALGKQVALYRKKADITLERLETLSGVDIGTINALEKRDSKRSIYAPALAKAFGLTVEELLDESQSYEVKLRGLRGATIELMKRTKSANSALHSLDSETVSHDDSVSQLELNNFKSKNSEFNDRHKIDAATRRLKGESVDIVIPQYDAGGSMGGGRLLLAEQPGLIKSWHVDHEWVRQNVKHYSSLENLCIVTGFGNSMKPMFNPGDPLLVDRGVNIIDHDAIFFFRIGEEGFIKQVQRIPDPMNAELIFRAKSKNQDYDSFDIHPSNPHFAVLGKVLTIWKSDQF